MKYTLTSPLFFPKLVQPVLFQADQSNLISAICNCLRADSVALVSGVKAKQADSLMLHVTQQFELVDALRMQAEFASSLGHRQNVGEFFMTVDKRDDYQFTAPHSEGSNFVGMQVAAFYCYENATDGGVTLLFNVADESVLWPSLRERVRRGRASKILSKGDIARAKALYRLSLPADVLGADDEVISEHVTAIDGLVLINALASPRRIFSRILRRYSYSYWDSISSTDFNSACEFCDVLKHFDLLKQPAIELGIDALDSEHRYRIRDFGVQFASLFKGLLIHKIAPGELMVLNNVTWSHAVSNWTPGSGTRNVVAAFA